MTRVPFLALLVNIFSLWAVLLLLPRQAHASCIHDDLPQPPITYVTQTTTANPKINRFKPLASTTAAIRFTVIDKTNPTDAAGQMLRCTSSGEKYWDGFNVPSSRTTGRDCGSTSDTECWRVCTAADVFTAEKQTYIFNKVIPETTGFFSRLLAVQPVTGTIDRGILLNCGTAVPIDQSSYGATDFVLFVTARPTARSVVAYASACLFDKTSARPLMGFVNFVPGKVQPSCDSSSSSSSESGSGSCTDASLLRYHFAVTFHELTHALGFSSSLYQTYRDPATGNPSVISPTKPIKKSANGVSHDTIGFTSPNVVAAARLHFNCPTLTSVELEDQGGTGTASSHWERRVLMNEVMTGAESEHPVVSNITLALFADTGWYTVNFTMAEPLYWGDREGCDFVNQRCGDLVGRPGYFCNTADQYGCNFDRSAVSACWIVNYKSAISDPWFQNFPSEPSKGGGDTLADYCPFYTHIVNGECDDLAQTMHAPMGGATGPDSKCFMSTVSSGNITATSTYRPVCYRFVCVSAADLRVRVGKIWFQCPLTTGGGSVEIKSTEFSGKVLCPDPTAFCARTSRRTLWPDLLDVSPAVIESTGEQDLTLYGKYFTGFGMTVTVGGKECEQPFTESSATMYCTTPVLSANDTTGTKDSAGYGVEIVITDSKGRTVANSKLLRVTISAAPGPLGPSPILMGLLLLLLSFGVHF